MTMALQLKGGENVLEVGTGSGYQAAILAEIVGEKGQVYTIERIPSLAESSQRLLEKLGYKNIKVFSGDGTLGLPEKAPFDAIIVTAGAPRLPGPLMDQLVNGGRFVMPIGDRPDDVALVIGRIDGDQILAQKIDGYRFVPLIGEYGWHISPDT